MAIDGKNDNTTPKRIRVKKVFKGVSLYADYCLTAAIFAMFAIVIWLLYNSSDAYGLKDFLASIVGTGICVPLCKWVFCKIYPFIGKKNKNNKGNCRKFGDQSWQLMVHVIMTGYELYLIKEHSNGEWWYNTAELWTPTDAATDNAVKNFYLIQLGIWFSVAFSHKFIEAKRKDYFVMYGHHVVTILLVLISYATNYFVFGTMILFIHDSSDIVVDLLKMANYLGAEDFEGFFLTEICFVTNLVTWFYCRLICLPMYIRSSFNKKSSWFPGDSDDIDERWPKYTCQVLLTILVFMHIWWYYLFLRIAARLIGPKQTELQNVGKEEYEDESGDEYEYVDACAASEEQKNQQKKVN